MTGTAWDRFRCKCAICAGRDWFPLVTTCPAVLLAWWGRVDFDLNIIGDKHFKICKKLSLVTTYCAGAIQCLKLKVLDLYSQTYTTILKLNWSTIDNCLKGENSVVRGILLRETRPKYFGKAERFCNILQYFCSLPEDRPLEYLPFSQSLEPLCSRQPGVGNQNVSLQCIAMTSMLFTLLFFSVYYGLLFVL